MSRPSLPFLFPLVLALLCLPPPIARAAHFADPSPSPAFVTVSLTATVGGSHLASGDEVAVYSVHPRPGVPNTWERTLVGHAVASGAGLLTVTVYGDDASSTGVVEGAVPGEELCLVLWRASGSKEYTAYTTPAGLPVAVVWTSAGDSPSVDLAFREGQRIPLRMGAWNLVSYGILSGYYKGSSPPGPPVAGSQLSGISWNNVATLGDAFPLKSIEGKYDRVVGNDGKGGRLWIPTLPGSTLAYLAPGYGYWVKMKPGSAPLSWMTVPGTRATLSETLSVSPGWTLLGYWDTGRVYHASSYDASWELVPVDASTPVSLSTLGAVWGSLGSSYERVVTFDGGGGKLWLPSLPGPSTMKYLAPGYGYWVKMSGSGTLAYPALFPPPTVLTLAATGLGRDNTVLAGSVNPNGDSTTAWFEWGTDPALAAYSTTQSQPVGSGTTSVPVNAALPGLSAGTTYYFRVAANNATDTSRGTVVSFTVLPAQPDPGVADIRDAFLAAVNQARSVTQMCGTTPYGPAPPVSWSDNLAMAAYLHSGDMALNNFFSHTGSDGSSPGQRISRQGYPWWTYGENIAVGYPTVSSVIQGWLGSAGHCQNMMNPAFTEIGAGYAIGPFGGNPAARYWTFDLADR